MDEIGAEKPVSSMTIKTAIDYLHDLRRRGSENEPVFILRGSDMLAPVVVIEWVRLATKHGVGLKKLAGASDAAVKMLAWPVRRLPD